MATVSSLTQKDIIMSDAAFHIMYLKNQFRHRHERNSRYSLRAFAKDLDIDSGQLSKIISGKLPISIRRASSMIKNLNVSVEERELFLRSVANEQAAQAQPSSNHQSFHEAEAFSENIMDYDLFLAISDLTHFALMELTYLEQFKSDSRWMARQLKLPVIEVDAALNRLIRLGVLKRTVDGEIRKTQKNLSTGYKEFSSAALRAHHRQVLKQAMVSLDRDDHGIRSNHSVTLAIDSAKLKIARDMTMKFLAEVTKVLESGKQSKLYQISFNIFPLQLEG